MRDVKAEQFLRRLFAKTMAGEVTWERTPEAGVFQTTVASYIVLFQPNRRAERKLFEIRLLDTEGAMLDSYDDEMFDERGHAADPGSMFVTMTDAYSTARRQAMGIVQALDEILDELGEGEPAE